MSQPSPLQQKRKKRRMMIVIIGALLFMGFMMSSLFGDTGILVGLQIKSKYQELNQEQMALLEENAQLKAEIRKLKEDPRAIEAIGRKEFGFAKPGEVVFIQGDTEAKK